MLTMVRTNSDNADFVSLVRLLDAELAVRDGEDHSFYAQFNSISKIKYAVVCYDNNIPVACGALREIDSEQVEIKRMFVNPESRKQGIASLILLELEKWAVELSFTKCILETGKKQPEAIALYSKCGYHIIDNYGQYADIVNSICFEKTLPLP